MSMIQFGEKVKGYDIPVLNEREIRAAAGILFLLMFISIVGVIFTWNFTLLKYATTFFLVDISIRVFVSPRFSPALILGRLIVKNQTPEYVGAAQKKFAWSIGVVLSGAMFVSLVVFNTHSPMNGIICMICLVFLFFETAFGICLGCIFYKLVSGKNAQYCPGEICDVKSRQPIQKISASQIWAILAVAALMTVAGYSLQDQFTKQPTLIYGMEKPPHIR